MELQKYKRPKTLRSTTFRERSGCGYLYITITYDDVPREMFLSMGKAGGCIYGLTVTIARLISTALRYGISIKEISKQIENEKCPNATNGTLSCGEAITSAIQRFIQERSNEKEREANRQAAFYARPKLRAMDGQDED